MTTPRMSLANITRGKLQRPYRILIAGVEGVGKSTFGASAPGAIFQGAEEGTHHLDTARLPAPERWEDILEGIRLLTEEDHEFKTYVLDTTDWAEPLCWEYVSRKANKTDIEDFGYGKGYTAAVAEWRRLLSALDRLSERKGMHIVLIAHSHIKTFKNPTGEDYDRYALAMHAKSAELLKQWADAMLFAQYEVIAHKSKDDKRVRGVDTGERVLQTQHSGAWDAKNRYSLPPVLPLSWEAFAKAAEEGLSGKADELIAEAERVISTLEGDRKQKAEEALRKVGRDTDRLERCIAWLGEQANEQRKEVKK